MISLQTKQFMGQVERQNDRHGIIASVTTYPDTGYAEKMHYHETFVLSMVIQGGNLERRQHTDIERTSGKVTYHNAGDPHQILYIRPQSRHLNIEVSEAFLNKHHVVPDAGELGQANEPGAALLMCRLYQQIRCRDNAAMDVETLALQLLKRPKKYYNAADKPLWVSRVREILKDQWNEPLELTFLARAAGLHPAHLSAYFPIYFGCTLTELRRKIKLEKAFALIQQRKYSLTDIAFECGFADQSHFIRVCKTMTDCTPSLLKKIFV